MFPGSATGRPTHGRGCLAPDENVPTAGKELTKLLSEPLQIEALRLDTIIMYTSWLEAELGAEQVAGVTG